MPPAAVVEMGGGVVLGGTGCEVACHHPWRARQGATILEVGGGVSPLAATLASSGPGGTWASGDAVGGVGDNLVG